MSFTKATSQLGMQAQAMRLRGLLLLCLGLTACGAQDAVPTPELAPSARGEFLEIAAKVRASSNEFLGGAPLESLVAQLESKTLEPAERLQLELDLCLEQLKVGELEAAKTQVEASLARLRQATPSASQGEQLVKLLRLRGIVHLRDSERENCIARHNPSCCIFPLEGEGLHSVSGPAQEALESFLEGLRLRPGDVELRWLLNLAAQALGDSKQLLPETLWIDPKALDEGPSIGRFRDVGAACGVNPVNLCGGCALEDFDGDGLLDIVSSTYDLEGPLHLHRSTPSGRFEDRSVESGLSEQLGGLNVISADYDNDGDMDLLVLRGAWLLDQGQIRNSLLRNDGQAGFVDVTRAAGLAQPARPTQAAVFADFDADGDLDLFVGNESRREMGTLVDGQGDYPSQLFLNDGHGGFRDVALERGVTNDRYAKGVSAGDYDNDGDMDLYVSNVGPNRLYQNDGRGYFLDVAKQLGVEAPTRSFATWFFDFDNDGWLDLFVAGYRTKLKHLAADYLGLEHKGTTPRLYLNDQEGGFRNITRSAGLDHAWLPMGANFGDLDGDGWLDIYLATGDPAFETLMPNVLLHNQAGRRLRNATYGAGLGHLQKGHGVAFGDIDNDGDLDLYHQLGGFYPDDAYANALFLNPGHGTTSVSIRLQGESSNRQGIGARLHLSLESPTGERQEIHRAVGSVSSFGGSPSRQDIGLGQATKINRLEVYWPKSGTRQVFKELDAGQLIVIREGAEEPELRALQRIPLPPVDAGE